MKKFLFYCLTFALLGSVSYANSCSDCKKMPDTTNQQNSCAKETMKSCDKCTLEDDDEYCIYNQCFFDKQFKKMKAALCLTKQQECNMDELYKDFKADMEIYHAKYTKAKNCLLEKIECANDCTNYKDDIETLKGIKQDAKERCKCFDKDIKAQLCKSQMSDYRKFKRMEKRKMKKLAKYAKIYKFPCTNCSN